MSAKVRHERGAYWVVVHHRGKRQKQRIGPTATDKRRAQRIAAEVNAALISGLYNPDGTPEPVAFDRYARAWLQREVVGTAERRDERALSASTVAMHERHVRLYLIPHFKDRDLRKLTPGDVGDFASRLAEAGKPKSSRSREMVLQTLGRILASAEAREDIERSPYDPWRRARTRRRGGRPVVAPENVLSRRELSELLEEAERRPDHFPLVLFLADTGCRIGEAVALTWGSVDLVAGTARIERALSRDGVGPTKTGRARTVELSHRLRSVLEARRPDLIPAGALVFPGPSGAMRYPGNF
jgi:integrase